MGRVQEAIQQDCCLMFEGIRRLIDGTCCLQGEEQICVWDLFGKLYTAFTEHVEFEEKWVLPRLGKEERAAHQSEHLRLRELMEKARYEFECAQGDSFRDILLELVAELRRHHENDPSFDAEDELARDPNVIQIVERSKRDLFI